MLRGNRLSLGSLWHHLNTPHLEISGVTPQIIWRVEERMDRNNKQGILLFTLHLGICWYNPMDDIVTLEKRPID